MIIFSKEPSSTLIADVVEAREQLKSYEKALADHLAAISNVKPGTLVRNRDTGATYRVSNFYGYLTDRGQVSSWLYGYRVYSTGRKEAKSRSMLNSAEIEVVSHHEP